MEYETDSVDTMTLDFLAIEPIAVLRHGHFIHHSQWREQRSVWFRSTRGPSQLTTNRKKYD
jgi:hypothetical protein